MTYAASSLTAAGSAAVNFSNIESISINTTSSPYTLTGTSGADNLTVTPVDADTIKYAFDGQPTVTVDGISAFVFDGGDGADTMTVVLSGSTTFLMGGLTFNGQDPATNPGDQLVLIGGTFATVTHNLTGIGAGNIDLNSDATSEITYTGLEPVNSTGSTMNYLVFNILAAGTTDAVLSDHGTATDGNSQLKFTGASSLEDIIFANPAGSVTINSAGTNSVVGLANMDSGFAPTSMLFSGVVGDKFLLTQSNSIPNLTALTVTTATLDLNGFSDTIGSLAGDGPLMLGSGTLTTGGNNTDTTFSGVISGSGGLTKEGAGTFTLQVIAPDTAPNTYTGLTNVNTGTLRMLNRYALGDSTGGTTVAAGAVLELANDDVNNTYEPLILNGTLRKRNIGSPSNAWVGDITLGPSSQLLVDSGQTLGVLKLTGAGDLNKNGAGLLLLHETSDYTGATNINAGKLETFGPNRNYIPDTSPVTLAAGTVFDMRNQSEAIFNLSGSGTIENTFGPNTLTVGVNDGSSTFDGVIQNGAGTDSVKLTKTGTGSLTLTGMSTYTGATAIEGGSLLVNGSITSATTIQTGATLGGKGTVGVVTALTGGTVSPGLSPGILNTGNLNLNSGATFRVELNGTTLGTEYDQANVTGTVNLNADTGAGAKLAVSLGFLPTIGNSFTIINNNLVDSITTRFVDSATNATLENTDTLFVAGTPLEINYAGGSGNDVVLSYDQTPVINADEYTSGDSAITVVRVGANIVAKIGSTTVLNAPVANLTSLTIHGQTGDDTLTIDFAGGNPIPSGGLFFNGDTNTSVPNGDTLTVIGGNFTNIVTTFANANDGTINFDGSVVQYTGLEPVLLNVGTVQNIIFNLPGGGTDDNAILEDDGVPTNDTSRLRSQNGTPTFETTTFTNPSNSLTVNMGMSSGMFTIDALDAGFSAKNPDVAVNGQAGDDTITLNARTGTGTYTIDGGGGINDTLIGTVAGHAWNLTASNAGNLDVAGVIDFAFIENLTGRDGTDTFTIGTGGTLTGAITGGGGAGTDTIIQTDGTNTWDITAANVGDVTDIGSFAEIENLTGGSGDDTFTFSAVAGTPSLGGDIDGGSGADTIVLTDGTNSWTISGVGSGDVSDLSVNYVGSFVGIESLTGGSGDDTFNFSNAGSVTGAVTGGGGSDKIVGDADGNVFTVTAVDIGALAGKTSGFSSIESLTGGASADSFAISSGASLSGGIDGLGGNDTLSFAAFSTAVAVTLTNPGTTDGFDGTQSSIAGGFDNIDILVGGSASDTLTGDNAVSTWALGASQTYTSAGQSVAFSGFETLQGGSDADSFNVTANTTANLLGGAGDDTFTISAGKTLTGSIDGEADSGTGAMDELIVTTDGANATLTSSDSDGFAGTVTGISVGFDGIDTLNATGSGTGTLTGQNAISIWDVFADTVTVGADVLTFTGFATLQGGTQGDTFSVTDDVTRNLKGGGGADAFNITSGKTLTGTVDGEAGSDTLAIATVGISVTLLSVDTDGFAGTVTAGVSGGFDGIDELTASGGGTTLTGPNSAAAWDVDAETLVVSGVTLSFVGSNFANLQGGTASDAFGVSANVTANLLGGDGADAFTITDGTLTGSVNGEAGSDSLTLVTAGANATLAGSDVNGFNGTLTADISATGDEFDGIESLTGGGTGSLTGRDIQSTWLLDGTPTYNDGLQTLNFTSFATLAGGSQEDGFNVTTNTTAVIQGGGGNDTIALSNGVTLMGSIDGGVGSDTLDYGAFTTSLTVTLAADGGVTQANVTGGGTNLENLTTGWAADTVNVQPLTSGLARTLNGSNPLTSPGDVLNFDANGANITSFTSSAITVDGGGGVVNYAGFETINISNSGPAVIVNGTPGNDQLVVTAVDADTIQYAFAGGPTITLNGITTFTFNGDDGADTMTVDFSGSTTRLSGGVFFNGENPTTAIGDRLIVTGGTFATVVHNLTSAGAGNIDLNNDLTADITYTGLEPVDTTGSTMNHLVFNLVAGTTDAVLDDAGTNTDGNSQLRFTLNSLEDISFANPSGSLSIVTAGTSSFVRLDKMDTGFAPATMNFTGAATDTFLLVDSESIPNTTALTITTAKLDLNDLNETVGSLSGNGPLTLGSGRLTTGGLNTDTSFDGAISETGGLTKTGTGVFTLTVANTYSGATAVNGGSLMITHATATSTSSSVTVASAARFESAVDNARLANLVVNAGGFLRITNPLDTGSSATLPTTAISGTLEINHTAIGANFDGVQLANGSTVTSLVGSATYAGRSDVGAANVKPEHRWYWWRLHSVGFGQSKCCWTRDHRAGRQHPDHLGSKHVHRCDQCKRGHIATRRGWYLGRHNRRRCGRYRDLRS